MPSHRHNLLNEPPQEQGRYVSLKNTAHRCKGKDMPHVPVIKRLAISERATVRYIVCERCSKRMNYQGVLGESGLPKKLERYLRK